QILSNHANLSVSSATFPLAHVGSCLRGNLSLPPSLPSPLPPSLPPSLPLPLPLPLSLPLLFFFSYWSQKKVLGGIE
ncbi:MAG: hypothetical protein KDK63_00215, partial [Chlamydiia bacterium]|nr:hypothetical protein [Chlamydiia bacterium]